MVSFTNTYNNLPSSFYTSETPQRVPSPKLLIFNQELAATLSPELLNMEQDELTAIFSGQKILPTSKPISMAYAGHQFGHFSPRLGDGRAILLGEIMDSQNIRQDIVLKGSGRTSFSRNGDGKATLGSTLREYLISEAMHALGVPTTRSLAICTTGEFLQRQKIEPGAILTRVSSSHIRVGTFEYFRNIEDPKAIRTLLDYLIHRNYPHLENSDYSVKEYFKIILRSQADLISSWMSLGFIHGVMNTDNSSATGLTIDYGPCAFMDHFKIDQVYSSIDHRGRYSYHHQASIGKWNLARLADALLLIEPDHDFFDQEIETYDQIFQEFWHKKMLLKLGIKESNSSDIPIISLWLTYLQSTHLDFTLAHRQLPQLLTEDNNSYFPHTKELENFLTLWKPRISSLFRDIPSLAHFTNQCNPLYIPRNHMVEKMIDSANNGDLSLFHKMNELLKTPFTYQKNSEAFTLPPKPEEVVTQTFCGT